MSAEAKKWKERYQFEKETTEMIKQILEGYITARCRHAVKMPK